MLMQVHYYVNSYSSSFTSSLCAVCSFQTVYSHSQLLNFFLLNCPKRGYKSHLICLKFCFITLSVKYQSIICRTTTKCNFDDVDAIAMHLGVCRSSC